MSTFTSRIRLEKQADGANPNSWGLILNQNVIDLVDDAIAGYTLVTVAADDVTLTAENGASDQARSAFIELTGTLTSSIDVVLPAQSKGYFIRNKTVPTPSSNTITIKTLAGSGATVGTSANGFFICDGVSVHQTNAVGLGLGTAANLDFGTCATGIAAGNLVPASSSDIRYVQASVASSITAAKTFTAPVIGNVTSLTDAASIAIDMGVGNNFAFTLAGNRTLEAPSNATPGQTGYIYITQDGTGSRTLAFNNAYIFVSGTAPTISTDAGAKDLLVYNVKEATAITAVVVKALATAT
tara:strand:+ start:445 stop:1338 length:894 start_codon:yes stop_codon:yes gene_type:complete